MIVILVLIVVRDSTKKRCRGLLAIVIILTYASLFSNIISSKRHVLHVMPILHDELQSYEESINSDAVVVYPTPPSSLPELGQFTEFLSKRPR